MSSMFGGTVYPPASRMDPLLARQRCAGWIISSADLAALARALPGTAVTFDHAAIKQACADSRPTRTAIEQVGREAFARSRDPKDLLKCPVGRVTAAFIDQAGAVRITAVITRGVADLIKSGAYSNFSLSHFANTTTPLEVAVTSHPGRPGCHVDAVIQAAADYKDVVARQLKTTIMSASEMTPLQNALGKLSPEDSKLIADRLCEMAAKTNAAVADKQALETTAPTEQDYQAAKAAFSQLCSHFTPAQKRRFGIHDNMIGDHLDNNPDRLRINNIERVLCACNALLAAKPEPPTVAASANLDGGSAKRRRVDEQDNKGAGQAVLNKKEQDLLLQQALASRFGGPVVTYD